MPEKRTAKRCLTIPQKEKRSVAKPRKRCWDDVESDLKNIGFGSWRKIAKERDAWKFIMEEAKALHGPQS